MTRIVSRFDSGAFLQNLPKKLASGTLKPPVIFIVESIYFLAIQLARRHLIGDRSKFSTLGVALSASSLVTTTVVVVIDGQQDNHVKDQR